MKVHLGSNALGLQEQWHPSESSTHLAVLGRSAQGTMTFLQRIAECLADAGFDVDYLSERSTLTVDSKVRAIAFTDLTLYLEGIHHLYVDRLAAKMDGRPLPYKPVFIVLDGLSTIIDYTHTALGSSMLTLPSLIHQCTGLGVHFLLRDETLTSHWYTTEISSTPFTKISASLTTTSSLNFWGVDTSIAHGPGHFFIGQSHRAPREFLAEKPRLELTSFSDAAQ